jgi:hypothetical protein
MANERIGKWLMDFGYEVVAEAVQRYPNQFPPERELLTSWRAWAAGNRGPYPKGKPIAGVFPDVRP